MERRPGAGLHWRSIKPHADCLFSSSDWPPLGLYCRNPITPGRRRQDEGRHDEGRHDEGRHDEGRHDEGRQDEGRQDEGRQDRAGRMRAGRMRAGRMRAGRMSYCAHDTAPR